MKQRISTISSSASLIGRLLLTIGLQAAIAAQTPSNPAAAQTVSHPVARAKNS
jgi:hypothetical protein